MHAWSFTIRREARATVRDDTNVATTQMSVSPPTVRVSQRMLRMALAPLESM